MTANVNGFPMQVVGEWRPGEVFVLRPGVCGATSVSTLSNQTSTASTSENGWGMVKSIGKTIMDPALWQYVNNPCYLQDINDDSSAVVNFDYFPVHIYTLPSINGAQATPQQLFEYFRLNWNQFIDNSVATFTPYQDPVINDGLLQQSSDPTTAMLHLNMAFNGSIIVSQFSATSDKVQMAVKTVRTPLDGEHPVSGTRMWGISPDGTGGYNFYTSGADRVTGIIETVLNTWGDRLPLIESGFEKADRLWTSLQDKMVAFIINNGGYAEKYSQPNFILRPQWDDVDLYLKKQIPLDELKRRIRC